MRNKAYDAAGWTSAGSNRGLIVILAVIFVCVTICFCASSADTFLPYLVVGWCGICIVLVVRNFLDLMWLGMILFIPMGINYFFVAEKSEHSRAICGLALGAEDICLIGLLFYLLFQVFIRRERKIYMPGHVLWPSLILLFLFLVASLKVENRLYGAAAMFASVRCWLFMFVVINYMRTSKELILFLLAIAGCLWFQSMIGVLQLLTGGFDLGVMTGDSDLKTNLTGTMEFSRVSGTQGSANSMALFLNLGLVVFFCIFLSRIPRKLWWLRGVAAVSIALALPVNILTYSRSAWLALAIVIVWVFLHLMHYYMKSMLKAVMITTVFSVIVACVGLAYEPVRERVFGEDYGSVEMRIPMIEVSIELIKDQPIGGVGLGEYCKYMGDYNKTPYKLGTGHPFPVHSMFFLLAAEAGIPTLIVYLIFFFIICSYGFKFLSRDVLDSEPLLPFVGAGMVFAIVAFIIQGQLIVYPVYAKPMIWLFFGAIVAVNRMLDEHLKSAKEKTPGGVPESV